MGGIYGYGCKGVYRFPHITYPYSSCICSFLQQQNAHTHTLFISPFLPSLLSSIPPSLPPSLPPFLPPSLPPSIPPFLPPLLPPSLLSFLPPSLLDDLLSSNLRRPGTGNSSPPGPPPELRPRPVTACVVALQATLLEPRSRVPSLPR